MGRDGEKLPPPYTVADGSDRRAPRVPGTKQKRDKSDFTEGFDKKRLAQIRFNSEGLFDKTSFSNRGPKKRKRKRQQPWNRQKKRQFQKKQNNQLIQMKKTKGGRQTKKKNPEQIRIRETAAYALRPLASSKAEKKVKALSSTRKASNKQQKGGKKMTSMVEAAKRAEETVQAMGGRRQTRSNTTGKFTPKQRPLKV